MAWQGLAGGEVLGMILERITYVEPPRYDAFAADKTVGFIWHYRGERGFSGYYRIYRTSEMTSPADLESEAAAWVQRRISEIERDLGLAAVTAPQAPEPRQP